LSPSAVAALAAAIGEGRRRALAQAITLAESERADHRQAAELLFSQLPVRPGPSLRIGIAGPPGVGKSTFIGAFGLHAIAAGRRVAVLAIDPSSPVSGGSILGDKTRMEDLARHGHAFIRPSPSRCVLGGTARYTRDAIALCEAAGYDLIVVETVGVGQSETGVADMVDQVLLLLAPAGGDELQGIKKGIVEIADLVVVNKADGDLAAAAERAVGDYRNALALLTPAESGWPVAVLACSAATGQGIEEVWATLTERAAAMNAAGATAERRSRQCLAWLWAEVDSALLSDFRRNEAVRGLLEATEAEVTSGAVAPTAAAKKLLIAFLDSQRRNH
jgi:LAO/AO transport system kinase